jgi:hypothetical protein
MAHDPPLRRGAAGRGQSRADARTKRVHRYPRRMKSASLASARVISASPVA